MSDDQIRRLYFGDNLEVMRELPAESVDLVYLDPPFNSKKVYNALFKSPGGETSKAQIQAFEDTWRWGPDVQAQYEWLVANPKVPSSVSKAISSFWNLLEDADLMAYLVMMTPRLLEIHRLMKRTGSMYLHCDPTASHYLKVICDQVFGPGNFQNEIIWGYQVGGRGKKRWARKHDVILFYSKTQNFRFDWRSVAQPRKPGSHMKTGVDSDGREYQEKTDAKTGKVYRYYMDEGAIPTDWWDGPQQLNREDAERLGYPTQKPEELLERIIAASSQPGDVVFDPFCGCGTTVAAAETLGRSWIGIDITYLAIELITKRMKDTHPGVKFEVLGVPKDVEGAAALFKHSHKEFEMWAVSMVGGRPNEKKGGDEGNDGVIFFYIDGREWGHVVVSVKGGDTVNPGMVRELIGTVKNERADMGVLITRAKPTKGMLQAAAQAGSYTWPPTGQRFEKIQIITVGEIFEGKRPDMPPQQGTFAQAPVSRKDRGHQPELLSD